MQDKILAAADELFNGQGIRAVGVDAVAARAGISKRTLYNYYPSKDLLVMAYLSRRYYPVKPSDRPPLDQILHVFDWLERWFGSEDFRGCPFVNAVAELGSPAAKIAVDFKEQRRLWFREMLQRLDAQDADGLATQLSILVEGAIATALVRSDPTVARPAKMAAQVLLGAAGIGQPARPRRKSVSRRA